MIIIIGESASGKSTVADFLEKQYQYKKIITYTTRPKREYEKDGVDYHFLTDSQFNELNERDFFAETAIYNNWKYGSAKKDYLRNNSIAVLTPKGLRQIRQNGLKNIYSVYLTVPRRDRLIACLNRGDDIEEAYRRSLSDVGQFDGVDREVDYVLNNPAYIYHPSKVAEMIMENKVNEGN